MHDINDKKKKFTKQELFKNNSLLLNQHTYKELPKKYLRNLQVAIPKIVASHKKLTEVSGLKKDTIDGFVASMSYVDIGNDKFESICIWSENYQALAQWYQETFELTKDVELNLEDDTGIGFMLGGVMLWIGEHSEVKGKSKDRYRIMPGFLVDSVSEL